MAEASPLWQQALFFVLAPPIMALLIRASPVAGLMSFRAAMLVKKR